MFPGLFRSAFVKETAFFLMLQATEMEFWLTNNEVPSSVNAAEKEGTPTADTPPIDTPPAPPTPEKHANLDLSDDDTPRSTEEVSSHSGGFV